MKVFLFFLASVFLVSSSFGQEAPKYNQNTNNNSRNEELEEIRLEVPVVPQTMPQLEEQQHKKQKKEITAEKSISTAQQTSLLFLNSRKLATTQWTSRSPSPLQQQEMNQAISFYKANAPESFEYHYFTYAAGNYDVSLYPHLKKAQELKPANSDVTVQLAAYNTITGNTQEASKNLTDLVKMGRIESEVLSYDTDLLSCIPANGVLLTHGFDDGFGTFYLNATNVRTDVKLISLDLMQSKAYRDSLEKAGFKMPLSTTIDVQFLDDFCQQNESKNLYLSMTFPKPYFSTGILDNLTVHGLVFAYGGEEKAILEENEILWQKLLKKGFIYKAKTEKGKQLSANYLPLLFYLREKYEREGRTEKLAEIDKAIDQAAMQSNRMLQVNSMRGRQ